MSVQIDADGQHEPSEAKRLLSRLADGFDLVVGSRFGGDDPTPYEVGLARRTSMRLLAPLLPGQTSAGTTDATSGFRLRAGRARAVRHLLPHRLSQRHGRGAPHRRRRRAAHLRGAGTDAPASGRHPVGPPAAQPPHLSRAPQPRDPRAPDAPPAQLAAGLT